MLDRKSLRGTWATVLLPIEADDSINWEKLREEVEILAGSGVDGIYTNGSAGEFFSQSTAEFLQINRLVAESCREAGLPFQIGACHPMAGGTLDRIRLAASLAPDAFQVILPDWFPVRLPEALAFLRRVASVAPVPLVLYLPPHAKTKFGPSDLAELAEGIPSLIGVKISGGDAAWYQSVRTSGVDLAVFVAGHHLATGVSMGAHGSYSNVACLQPRSAARWQILMKTDLGRAMKIETEIQTFLQRHILPLCGRYVDAAIDKLLAHAGGWARVGTRLRWPYQSPSPQECSGACRAFRLELPMFLSLAENDRLEPLCT